jgi:hypothetical protein
MMRPFHVVLSCVLWIVASLGLAGCQQAYTEFNPDANVAVDFLANANKLSFGVSTGGSAENTITVNPDKTVTIKAMNSTANAGKIAGSEDGISYFFKEVDAKKNFKLSATVVVNFFGGLDPDGVTLTSNGQEGFGLMARDYVPQYAGFTLGEVKASLGAGGTEYHAAPLDPATGKAFTTTPGGSSNMVMVGGVKRGVRAAIRRGVTGKIECVTDPNVISSAGKSIFEYAPKELLDYSPFPNLQARPDFPAFGKPYKFSLVKTNSGFVMTLTPPAEKGVSQEVTYTYPDNLFTIKNDKYYVGFFAARAAEIVVSNISYYESDASLDAVIVPAKPEVIVPSLTIQSLATASDSDFRIHAVSNVKGAMSVTQDGVLVPGGDYFEGTWYSTSTMPQEAGIMADACVFDLPVLPLKPGPNTFQIAFYPDETQSITSNAPVRKVLTVDLKTYGDTSTPLFVSPTGRKVGAGTLDSPLDLNTAIDFVQPGQQIILLDGVYNVLSIKIPRYNNGQRGALKQLVAQDRNQVFLDFGKDINANGFELWGDFWRIDGIHVRNTPDKKKGFTVLGNNNIVEYVKTYNNGDTGLQISGVASESSTWWPTNNTIRYCESFDNLDAAMNDADGFAAKLTVGKGNKFQWCVSHHNCDDGWDLFTKKESGTIGVVTLENCITYRNGTMLTNPTPGYHTNSGRNGFKLGGEGLAVAHVLINCLAFQNGAHGFTSNSNSDIVLTNCTSFDNGIVDYNPDQTADSRNFTIYNGSGKIPTKNNLTGILSLYSAGTGRSEDKIPVISDLAGYGWLGSGTGSTTGTATRNKSGVALVDATHPLIDLVKSVTPPLTNELLSRDSQGRFVIGDFLALKAGKANDSPGANFVY